MSLSTEPDYRHWSLHERHGIERIRAACLADPDLQLEGGRTDEGDPWCIVYDRARDRVVLHIARIDQSYIIVRPRQFRLQKVSKMRDAIEVALEEIARERPTNRMPEDGCFNPATEDGSDESPALQTVGSSSEA
jgi:hypothetical protein